MRTEVVQGSLKGRGDLRKAHASPAKNHIQRPPYSPENANEGDSVAFVRREPLAPSAMPTQQPQKPQAKTAAPVASNGTTAGNSNGIAEVEGTGCTYVLQDEIGRGAYGRVYLADVIRTDSLQSTRSLPTPPLSVQLPSLRRSAGGGLVDKANASSASNSNTNNNSCSINSTSNCHHNNCRNNGTNTTRRMVLKRMENASVEDGVQAATLREFMVLDEVSMSSFDRERSELEAFRVGQVAFRTTHTNAVVRPCECGTYSFVDNNNYMTNTEGKWDDEVLTTSTSRNDDYDCLSSTLRRRIDRGRSYLIGMRDSIMVPQEQLAYVAMDYCEGGDLWHFIRDLKLPLKTSGLQYGSVMPAKVFRRWAVELILALAFLHSRNISHRDLKPQNLMLAKRTDISRAPPPPLVPPVASPSPTAGEGGGGGGNERFLPGDEYNLKVGDFGLSRLEDIPYKKYVHEAVTLWYRSPDVLLGNTNYTFSADAWSLGCILIEMASGSVLFKGRDEADELRHIFTRGCRPSLLNFPRLKEYPYTERFMEVLQRYRDTESEAKLAADGADAVTALQAHVEKLARHLRAFLKERHAHELLGVTGIDLVARLLVFDPERRLTVLQAVHHRFFMEAYAEIYGSD
ncbi:putative protein kinase [Leptomonas seymouri]|uniref:Protein kinase domain-containing protein n=1 Tax=Leptomonas seymouri TaxID=5684 RepID=A0A0N0P661_LEPSE|nr:putative protein kinase [Leptomonas seymouri]|eukprot:KPI86787.1 putative protein kinase [Leptomonas seymouri]